MSRGNSADREARVRAILADAAKHREALRAADELVAPLLVHEITKDEGEAQVSLTESSREPAMDERLFVARPSRAIATAPRQGLHIVESMASQEPIALGWPRTEKAPSFLLVFDVDSHEGLAPRLSVTIQTDNPDIEVSLCFDGRLLATLTKTRSRSVLGAAELFLEIPDDLTSELRPIVIAKRAASLSEASFESEVLELRDLADRNRSAFVHEMKRIESYAAGTSKIPKSYGGWSRRDLQRLFAEITGRIRRSGENKEGA